MSDDKQNRRAHPSTLCRAYAGGCAGCRRRVGLAPDGRLFALNSYENRVYQLGAGDEQLVLKFYRPARWSDAQIAEEHQFTAELAEAELPVAAPLTIEARRCFSTASSALRLSPGCAGAPRSSMRPRRGRSSAGRWHGYIRSARGGRSRYARVSASQRLGWEARAQVLRERVAARGLRSATPRSAGAAREVEAVFDAGRRRARDPHSRRLPPRESAVERAGSGVVDLDDCAMGPRVQDLWMMLSGSAAEQQRPVARAPGGLPAVRRLRLPGSPPDRAAAGLRMMHHAAWVVHRWADPAFPRAFPWFGEARYWEGYLRDLMEQIERSRIPRFCGASRWTAGNADSVRALGARVALLCGAEACMHLILTPMHVDESPIWRGAAGSRAAAWRLRLGCTETPRAAAEAGTTGLRQPRRRAGAQHGERGGAPRAGDRCPYRSNSAHVAPRRGQPLDSRSSIAPISGSVDRVVGRSTGDERLDIVDGGRSRPPIARRRGAIPHTMRRAAQARRHFHPDRRAHRGLGRTVHPRDLPIPMIAGAGMPDLPANPPPRPASPQAPPPSRRHEPDRPRRRRLRWLEPPHGRIGRGFTGTLWAARMIVIGPAARIMSNAPTLRTRPDCPTPAGATTTLCGRMPARRAIRAELHPQLHAHCASARCAPAARLPTCRCCCA